MKKNINRIIKTGQLLNALKQDSLDSLDIYEIGFDFTKEITTEQANNIKYLKLTNPYKKRDLEWLEKFPNLESFSMICGLKKINIKGLHHLSKLRNLELRHFTKVESLEFLKELDHPELIETLVMEHFPNLISFKGIENLSNLKTFNFDGVSIGSEPKKVKINNLKPLASLKKLESIRLTSIRLREIDIDPLLNFEHLKEASFSMDIFTQDDYIKFSAYYPNINYGKGFSLYTFHNINLGNNSTIGRCFFYGKGKRIIPSDNTSALDREFRYIENKLREIHKKIK